MTDKRYSVEGYTRAGHITRENGDALRAEVLEIATRIEALLHAYCEETGRRMDKHSGLAEVNEIRMLAAATLVAAAAASHSAQADAEFNLQRAHKIIDDHFQLTRELIRDRNDLHRVTSFDVN